MNKSSDFEMPEFEESEFSEKIKKIDTDTDAFILEIISESDVNPLDIDTPTNSGRGRYLLLKKKRKKDDEDDDEDSDYKDIFDAENVDISEGEAEFKTEQAMKKHKEMMKYASSFLSDYVQRVMDVPEKNEVINIKYSTPIRMGHGNEDHAVYQRIILKNTGSADSVYKIIKDKLEKSGIELEVVDATFEGRNVKYISSVDGKRENFRNNGGIEYVKSDMYGEENASWEVLVDGKFLLSAIGEKKVKEGSVIEIRRKSGCGGGVTSDPLTLLSDPTIDKRRLPSYIRNMNSVMGYDLGRLGASGYLGNTFSK